MLAAVARLSAAEVSSQELVAQAQQAFGRNDRKGAIALMDKAVAAAPDNGATRFMRAGMLDEMRDFAGALKDYTRVIELAPKLGDAYELRGAAHFKLGHIAESIADFDQFIKLNPAQEPHHWQRGISYYYAGKFADGKRQFEIHQTVNPRDVENAAWHFLCNARLNGVEKARKDLIPIEGDARVPMKEVQALFAGKGTVQQVLDAAEAGKVSGAQGRNNRFYAHLYLGLYFEALGDEKQTRAHIEKAAKDFSEDHYMGDVARVHLKLMNEAPKKK